MTALVDVVAILSPCQRHVLSANWFVSETSRDRRQTRVGSRDTRCELHV